MEEERNNPFDTILSLGVIVAVVLVAASGYVTTRNTANISAAINDETMQGTQVSSEAESILSSLDAEDRAALVREGALALSGLVTR